MHFDEDDDTFVTIGTPFEIPEENEPLKKPAKVEDQIAVDQQGRRRFHGAFTGGFSAGYFNTVGSKEGWSPSTFHSSRSQKVEDASVKTFTPEDFMDEEDFAEHGIAPRKLKTASLYDSTEKEVETRKRHLQKAVDDGDVHSAIPGGIPMDDLLLPSKLSIGIKLLKKMGWKPGQGIGEKVDLIEDIIDSDTSRKKIYGCVRPPGNNNNLDSMDMKTFIGLLAPKDIQPFQFSRKDNLHGIGYSGINPQTAMFGSTSGKPTTFKPTGKEKRGIKGQAFGVGVFEEEDDDIYGNDQLSNYDLTMGLEDEADQTYGWSGYKKQASNKDCLPGFIKSSITLIIAVPCVSIKIPVGFIPKHVFPEDNQLSLAKPQQEVNQAKSKLSSKERSLLLGERTKTLDDVSSWTLKWDKQPERNENKNEQNENKDEQKITEKNKNKRFSSRWDMEINQERAKKKTNDETPSSSQEKISMYDANTGAFKPFAKNPAKQCRYEEFLAVRRTGGNMKSVHDKSFTEWEREREIEEFSRAGTLYRPLSSSIAARFTRATIVTANIDENVRNETEDDKCEAEDKKAARMGMFGKLTRTVVEWHPDKILCKRFNIPHPYTNSNIKGVPGRGKKKSNSFFDDDTTESPAAMLKDRKDKNREDEDDELTEMLKRKEKLQNKTKIKIGPLSHLNNLNASKTGDSLTESPSIVDSMNIGTETNKPSMDIFKAIFDSSDSSSDESHADEDVPETKTDDATKHSPISEQPMKQILGENEPMKSQSGNNKKTNQNPCKEMRGVDSKSSKVANHGSKFLSFLNKESGRSKDEETKEICKSIKDIDHEVEENISNSYTTTTSSETSTLQSIDREACSQTQYKLNQEVTNSDKQNKSGCQKTTQSSSDESDKCWEEKQLPKNKKHKKHRKHSSNRDKHKHKHKKERKKKKKKRKHASSNSSSDDDDDDDDDDSIVPSNMQLLMKLKKASNTLKKRPSAADFM